MLPRYAGVLATETGHVSVHEAGAIEFTGHKVLPLSSHDGKIDAADIRRWLLAFYADGNHDHMVFPGMVYISHPTEYGTLYAKDELIGIRDVCNEYKIPLYLDGARLGYGLACPSADVTLKDIAALTDVFYIGGTKVGALFGEAVVFTRHNAPDHFITIAKQHGALLAKGWLLGIQFETLFSDGLYEQLGRNAVMQADMIRKALQDKGYHIHMASPTNQIFLELDDQRLEDLQRHVAVSFWEKTDRGHTVVRLATSWATTDAQVSELLRHL
jgi:threonine aldolase